MKKISPETSLKREMLPDVVKALAIIMVVWGHAIQYWHGEGYNYWGDPFFIFIYSFHMPLFALVSGYFAIKSIQKNPSFAALKKRTVSLIVPFIFWGICLRGLANALTLLRGEISIGDYIIELAKGAISSPLWFLLATWTAFILIYVIEKAVPYHLEIRYVLYTIISIVAMLIPRIPFGNVIGFVLPFFFLGAAYGRNHDSSKRFSNKGLVLITAGFIVLLVFWRKDAYIYTSGIYLNSSGQPFRQLVLNVYRIVIGLMGALSFIGVLQCLPITKRNRNLALFGINSGVIYIVSTIAFLLSQKAIGILGFNSIESNIGPAENLETR